MTSVSDTSALFRPLPLGPLMLPNRILLAPLTRTRAGREHMPNELMAEYYAQRAGAGQRAEADHLVIAALLQLRQRDLGDHGGGRRPAGGRHRGR